MKESIVKTKEMVAIDFGKKNQKIQVAIVDDHALFRQGLKLVLGNFPDLEIIYEANHGKELIEKLVGGEPDVIFMDINMPIMDGLKTTKKLRRHFPQIKIIVLTMHDERPFIVEMIKNGANGYLHKNADSHELYQAINSVITQGFYFNKHMTEVLFNDWPKIKISPKISIRKKTLSKRELQVLQLICKQYNSEEIASKLGLQRRAIEHSRSRLLVKLGVRNTAGLVIAAVEYGLVNLNLPTKKRTF